MTNNPSRGCGTMKEDSYYLKGFMDSDGHGQLWPWTWVLGDGYDEVILIEFPARQVTVINPAAIMTTKELITAAPRYRPSSDTLKERYADMKTRTRGVGIGDHVGATHYSAHSFAKETKELGPSRKISRDTAIQYNEMMAKYGPLPIMFTHKRVPLFRSIYEQEKALDHVQDTSSEEINWGEKNHNATWLDDKWGQYAEKRQTTGQDHYMVQVLGMIGQLDTNWRAHSHTDAWHEARAFAKSLNYVEQPIGLSWLTGVTYTLPSEGKAQAAEKAQLAMPGVDILDLDAEESEVTNG